MMKEEALKKDWKVEGAWVSPYNKQGYGALADYHPDPSDIDGPGACRVSTIITGSGANMRLQLKICDDSNSGKWPPKTQELLEEAVFTPCNDQDFMLSTQFELNDPAFNPYTHVIFAITQVKTSGKRTFTTNVLWSSQPVGNGVVSVNSNATGYPWKDP